MAPAESQEAIKEFGRPEYEKVIADNPSRTAAQPEQMVIAFRTLGRAGRRREDEVTTRMTAGIGVTPVPAVFFPAGRASSLDPPMSCTLAPPAIPRGSRA